MKGNNILVNFVKSIFFIDEYWGFSDGKVYSVFAYWIFLAFIITAIFCVTPAMRYSADQERDVAHLVTYDNIDTYSRETGGIYVAVSENDLKYAFFGDSFLIAKDPDNKHTATNYLIEFYKPIIAMENGWSFATFITLMGWIVIIALACVTILFFLDIVMGAWANIWRKFVAGIFVQTPALIFTNIFSLVKIGNLPILFLVGFAFLLLYLVLIERNYVMKVQFETHDRAILESKKIADDIIRDMIYKQKYKE